jgi:hypothetical protein
METISGATKAASLAEKCHGRDHRNTVWVFDTYSDWFIHNLLRIVELRLHKMHSLFQIVEPRLHKNVSTSFKDGGQADYPIGYSEC